MGNVSDLGDFRLRQLLARHPSRCVERSPSDPDDALKGWSLLDDNLNGVIWYTARITTDSNGMPELRVEGDVVPNPHQQDDNNAQYCSDLADRLFNPS